MKPVLLGALLGLVVGAVLGGLLAIAVHSAQPAAPPEEAATRYPPLGKAAAPLPGQHVIVCSPLNDLLFQGILLGGGFGSVVGAIAAATGVLVRTSQKPGPS
jgi:hypothetical protein